MPLTFFPATSSAGYLYISKVTIKCQQEYLAPPLLGHLFSKKFLSCYIPTFVARDDCMFFIAIMHQSSVYCICFATKIHVSFRVSSLSSFFPISFYSLYHVIASIPALRRTQPIQCLLGLLSSRVKRQTREADHSHPLSDEVKKTWVYTSIPPYVFIA
jgi:hypothetical protein